MTILRFGLLGPLEFWRDGSPVQVPSGRRRAVLACLVANAGRPVGIDTLVTAGWGDELPDRPRAALNTVISRLRALLGGDVLCSDPAGYRLDIGPDTVDVTRFETLCEQANHAPASVAVDLIDEALGLWRGPAYAEFVDRDFARLEAQRLDRLRLEAAEMRASLLVETPDVERAIASLESVLADHPFRERAIHLLMTALYRGGRVTEALDRYRDYRNILSTELGLEPSPALQDLQQQILGHKLAPTPAARAKPGAPVWRYGSTTFVGRDAASVELLDAIASNRLVTVTGAGGVGKTRLVVEALALVAKDMTTPITVVELGSVRAQTPEGADAAVADALGLSHRPGEARAACVEYLSITEMVLVLDNCEHLLSQVAPLAEAIERRCPRVHFVATSRQRLHLTSERVVPLEPLPLPPPTAPSGDIPASPAVELFTDRLRRVRPRTRMAEQNWKLIAEICRMVDGVPLALELAASRTAVLGPRAVWDQLTRDLGPQHPSGVGYDSLAAVVDWSYALLTPEQRRRFTDLSVFVGAFDAADVAGLAEPCEGTTDVAVQLGALAEASLLVIEESGSDLRYRLLTQVRAQAARLLAESGREDDVRLAHARWASRMVQHAFTDQCRSAGPGLLATLDRRRGDVAAALRWTMETERWPIAGELAGGVLLCRQWPLGPEIADLTITTGERYAALPDPPSAMPIAAGAAVLADRGELDRSRALATRALDLSGTPIEQFLARAALGVASVYAGAFTESRRHWRTIRALEIPPTLQAEGLISLALIACYEDDLVTAHREASAARAITEYAGSAAAHAFARYTQGEVTVKHDLTAGAAILGEAAEEADLAGAAHVSRVARLARFAALVRLGEQDDALDLVGTLLGDVHRAAAWPQMWTTLRVLAELLTVRREYRDAAYLLAAAEASDSAPPLIGDDIGRYVSIGQELRAHLGDAVMDGIEQLAASVDRTQVLDRTGAVLDRISGRNSSVELSGRRVARNDRSPALGSALPSSRPQGSGDAG